MNEALTWEPDVEHQENANIRKNMLAWLMIVCMEYEAIAHLYRLHVVGATFCLVDDATCNCKLLMVDAVTCIGHATKWQLYCWWGYVSP